MHCSGGRDRVFSVADAAADDDDVGAEARVIGQRRRVDAAGDVAGPYQFTHTAAHQAWYAAVNALFDPFKKFKVDYAVIPAATFVDPEVARVGLNEQEARAQGIAFETSTYPIDDLDRARSDYLAVSRNAHLYSSPRDHEEAEARAWEEAHGLEWTVPSPAPHHTFTTPPVIRPGDLAHGDVTH